MNRIVFPLIAVACVLSGPALAEDPAPRENPCVADPPPSSSDQSLTDQLDACNGVLTPPKVGDGEIVEPPPATGTLRVIRPPAVPEQQSGATGTAPGVSPDAAAGEYDISEVTDAVARAAATAETIRSIKPSSVNFRDISILIGGANAAVLNESLAEHAAALETLRGAISANEDLSAEVGKQSRSIQGVVAATVDGQNKVTLYVR